MPNYFEIWPLVLEKKPSVCFPYIHIRQISNMRIGKNELRPWRPCFLTDFNSLNNFDRLVRGEHFGEKNFEIRSAVSEKKIFLDF